LSFEKRKKSREFRSDKYEDCEITEMPFLVRNSITETCVTWNFTMEHLSVQSRAD